MALTRATSRKPMSAKGRVFPRMNSRRPMGVTMICSMVPISRSRTTAMLDRMMEMIMTSWAMTPGRKKKRLSRFGLNQAREAMLTGSASKRVPVVLAMRSARMWLLAVAAMRPAYPRTMPVVLESDPSRISWTLAVRPPVRASLKPRFIRSTTFACPESMTSREDESVCTRATISK